MGQDGSLASPPQPAAPAERGLGAAYRRLWISTGMSGLADGVFQVALPLVALQSTRSPVAIAGLAVATTLPWLVFALPAGALVDRVDRRRAMLGANTARAALLAVLVLAVLLDATTVWVLYTIALCAGVAETIYDTAAQSIVPQVVPRDRLSRANGRLHAVQVTANEFVGPPLAGALVAAGAVAAVATPVALWAAAAVLLLLLRGSYRIRQGRRTSLGTDIAEGLRFLWRQRILRRFTVMVGVFNLATNAAFTVFVLHAVGPGSAMGLSEQAYGLLLTTLAAGSLLGSFLAPHVEQALGRVRALALSFLVAALAVGVPAVTTNPYLVGAVFFVSGVGILVSNVVMVSLRQRITPDRLLGRVSSSHRLVAWGTRPLGALVGGALAQLLGLRAVFLVMGLVALAVLTLLVGVTDHALRRAEHDVDAG